MPAILLPIPESLSTRCPELVRQITENYKQHLKEMRAVDADDEPLRASVIESYEGRLPDELDIEVGDVVRIAEVYDDGYAKGTNERTWLYGVFPLACIGL
ncbi:hypothetical protein HK101_011027 [Irineochytrium annulatum]|nr:hypothetical protein HK101_011027 [Irineochytrium annulatum]